MPYCLILYEICLLDLTSEKNINNIDIIAGYLNLQSFQQVCPRTNHRIL